MKSLTYFVVILLIFSSITAIGIDKNAGITDQSPKKEITVFRTFLQPKMYEKDSFFELHVEGMNNNIFIPGQPMLPVHTETIVLPFGVKIIDIECEVQNIESMILSQKIYPAPQRIIIGTSISSDIPSMDKTVYNSNKFFPDNWFNFYVGVGLDDNNKHASLLTINTYPFRYNPMANTVKYAKNINLKIYYYDPGIDIFPETSTYDLVIIAPPEFTGDLQRLVDHKNNIGIKTVMQTTDEIYSQYSGVDKPEMIKYFIKDSLENWGVKYVLLVGGLNNLIWANPREDRNYGARDWRIPVRYSNLLDSEPGYVSDLYYADIYKEDGVFDNWDSNDDGIFAYHKGFSLKNDELDLYPDVNLGRLPCRNNNEVKSVVDKIIHYENNADPSWFNKMIVVSGDGFLDQENLDFEWDTNGLPTGQYTIFAQSTNPEGISGPIDETIVTLDKAQDTKLTFNHDDYLIVPNFPQYPASPVAKIMSVSNGDVLGKNDYFYKPGEGEAYCNSYYGYANVEYRDEILHIRGKTYDPKPYGYTTNISVWIKNSEGVIVFEDQRNHSLMYYEGEWATGEQMLHERAGALYYMPEDFTSEILWTSNGKWTGQSDVINSMNEGSGFVFFSGHGSPMTWGDQYPGIPGNRRIGSVTGLANVALSSPFFPMNKLTNDYKNPIVIVGGCHNSMFNITLLTTLLDQRGTKSTWCYGIPTPEGWSEWLTRLPKIGAIATIGNTGLGFGVLGEWCTVGGVDGWITTEFFNQYGTEGYEILGEVHKQCITNYIDTFGKKDSSDIQTVQGWILFGDPSLMIGGYDTN
jgi:hypothetical protein